MIILQDEREPEQKVFIAELYRNLGDFERCTNIINSIDNPDMEWIKEGYYRKLSSKKQAGVSAQ
ncbi:MAG: hypothetical protein U5Q03_00135 [Bacteroidota bacterium]|nr:hypothetical protein [Bacteroidota bacterium]